MHTRSPAGHFSTAPAPPPELPLECLSKSHALLEPSQRATSPTSPTSPLPQLLHRGRLLHPSPPPQLLHRGPLLHPSPPPATLNCFSLSTPCLHCFLLEFEASGQPGRPSSCAGSPEFVCGDNWRQVSPPTGGAFSSSTRNTHAPIQTNFSDILYRRKLCARRGGTTYLHCSHRR